MRPLGGGKNPAVEKNSNDTFPKGAQGFAGKDPVMASAS